MNLEKSKTDSKRFSMSFLNNGSANSVPELVTDEGRKQWVEWGKGDKMPYRLFELYNQSGFHRAIIDSRVDMMTGCGITQDLSEGEESKRTELFIDNPNPYEDMTSVYSKLSYDYELYGIAYIEIIYSADRSQIAQVNHLDASKVRWAKKIQNHLDVVYYSQNWTKLNKYKPEPIPVFNPALKDEYPRQIIPIVRYTPSVDYYTLPAYYSVIKWISIDFEISNFHENNIQNGLMPTIFFGFPMGDPTEAEMDAVEKKIKAKYSSTDKAGGFITAFYEPGSDNEVKVEVLSTTDMDKQYEWLMSATKQQILIGHGVTNENLVGISTPGKLGTSTEMLQSYELYYNTKIKPEVTSIVNALNKVMTYNGMNDIMIEKDTPISNTLSESVLQAVLTVDELRETIGYQPMDPSININNL